MLYTSLSETLLLRACEAAGTVVMAGGLAMLGVYLAMVWKARGPSGTH